MNRNAKLKSLLTVISLLLAGTLLSQVQAFQSGRPQTPTPPTFPPDQTRQTSAPALPITGGKWEYRIVNGISGNSGIGQYLVHKNSGRTIELEEEINALSTQGFEVQSITPLDVQGTTLGLSVLLRRPKP